MQEDYRLDMTQRSNALRTELNDFQRKYEANAFLTTERAQQEGNRLQKKQEELQNYAAKKEQELAAKQMELNGQLRDTIVAQLTTFNQAKVIRSFSAIQWVTIFCCLIRHTTSRPNFLKC